MNVQKNRCWVNLGEQIDDMASRITFIALVVITVALCYFATQYPTVTAELSNWMLIAFALAIAQLISSFVFLYLCIPLSSQMLIKIAQAPWGEPAQAFIKAALIKREGRLNGKGIRILWLIKACCVASKKG